MSDASPLRDIGEHRVRLMEQEAQLNLRTVLELCAEGELRCREKTSRASAVTVRAVDSYLAHGDFYGDDPIAAFAWPLLIQAGGLAKIEGGRLRLTPKGRAALRTPPPEVIRQLWQRWLTHAVIDEFSRIEEIKGQRASNVLTAAKARRQIVGTALATCPSDDWIGVDALPRRFPVRQPGLRGLPRLGDPGGPLHPRRAVRVRRHTGTARPGLRPPGRGARGLPEQLGRRRHGRAEPLRRPPSDPAHRAGPLRTRPDRHLSATRRR